MGHVDYLIRNPVIRKLQTKRKSGTIKELQLDNNVCKTLHSKPNKHYIIKDGIIYFVNNGKDVGEKLRVYVLEAARLVTMKTYHDDAAHIGWQKAIYRMKDCLYLPKMSKSMKKCKKNCRSYTVSHW